MITDKQFEDAFTAAGGWFIVTQFEAVYHWSGDRSDLIDKIYLEGFDKSRTGTNTRVSSLLRIIENNRATEALEKIRDSKRINSIHPEAENLAKTLLSKYDNTF